MKSGGVMTRVLTVVVALVFPLLLVGVPAQAASASSDSSAGLEPAYIVVAVDESGSIEPPEMQQEMNAANSILLDEFNPQSKMEVIGFGGLDSGASSSNPEGNTICPMTSLSTTVQRQSVESCVSGFHVRNMGQGENTDFITVVNQAVSDLQQAPTGYQKLLFLLTDGWLDVWGSPDWIGANQQEVDAKALQYLEGQSVPKAAAAGVSIWGLGFGSDARLDTLDYLAQHSYPDSCAAGGNKAQVIPDSTTLSQTLLAKFYSTARCSAFSGGQTTYLDGSESKTITLNVPAIATAGAIEVILGSTRDTLAFTAPDGNDAPASGSVDGTQVQLEGAGGLVQSLQLINPTPGPWTVQVTAPAGVAQQQIIAGVLWQGRVQSDIVLTNYQPEAGDQVTVTVQVSARPATTLTQQLLDQAGVQVVAGLSGAGFAPIRSVPLTPEANTAGYYTGTLTIPKKATGNLAFTGYVTGNGVAADERQTFAQVVPLAREVTATLTQQATSVQAGATLPVLLQLDNESGIAHDLTVTLAGTPSGVTVSEPTVPLSSASGTRAPVDIVLTIPESAPAGPIGGTISVTDSGTDAKYASIFLTARITLPPSLIERFRWLFIAVAVVVVLIVLGTWRLLAARRMRDSIQDIAIVLYNEHGEETERLHAPSGHPNRFKFTLRRDTEEMGWAGGGRLAHDPAGTGWQARRRRGGLVVSTPEGTELPLLLGESVALGDGLAIGYEDARPLRQQQIREAHRVSSGPQEAQPPEIDDPGLV